MLMASQIVVRCAVGSPFFRKANSGALRSGCLLFPQSQIVVRFTAIFLCYMGPSFFRKASSGVLRSGFPE